MAGGGKTATTTQQVQIPPEVLARYNSVNARAENVAQTPFQRYSNDPNAFVAPMNATQNQGIQNINNAAGVASPYYGAATGLTMAGAGGVAPAGLDVSRYMNPFTNAVANPVYASLRQQQLEDQNGLVGNAIRSGAFGGDRSGIALGNLQRQQQLATAQALTPIFQGAYDRAVGTAQQQQGVDLSARQADAQRLLAAGQQVAGLGSGLQGTLLQGGQAQLGAGTAQQQTEQGGLTALYNQFMQERGYPFQIAQFLANIAMGTGALSGSTTTTTQPAPFFSDERLKEDIEPVGKLFDGQPIYRYRMAGDPRTQIGLLAQDVEETHPEAVGLARGFRTVDYKTATDDAAARRGYAAGGVASPDEMKMILAMQQQFLGPYAKGVVPYGGQSQMQPGFVPAASLPVGQLRTAGNVPQARNSGLAEAAQTGSQLASLAQMGKGLYDKGKEWISSPGKPSGNAGYVDADTWISDRRQQDDWGRPGFSFGGMPYGGDDIIGGVVAEGTQNAPRQLPKPGEPPKPPQSGMSQLSGLAGGLSSAGKLGKMGMDGLGSIGSFFSSAAPEAGAAALETGLSSLPVAAEAGTGLAAAGAGVMEALAALGPLAIFSDERLKEDVEPVGQLYDGQPIYRYRMKGDPRTQIGLLAQDVEESHPEAVGLAGGFRTVDYGAATDEAAARRGYADGGVPSEDELIPRIMASEWGGKNPDELRAIGAVIRNRARERGLSPTDVVLETGRGGQPQFEPVGIVGRGNDPMLRPDNDPRLLAARKAWPASAGDDPTGGANHFYGPAAQRALGRPAPGWSKSPGVMIGDTSFHRVGGGSPPPEGGVAPPSSEISVASGRRLTPGVAGPGQIDETPQNSPFKFFTDKMLAGRDIDPATKSALTSENLWVPALAGIGSMLASRSPYLGNAVGEGLVGGTKAYTDLNKQQQDMAESRARTENIVAGIANTAFTEVGGILRVRVRGRDGGWTMMSNAEYLALPPNERPQIDPRVPPEVLSKFVQEGKRTTEQAKTSEPAAPGTAATSVTPKKPDLKAPAPHAPAQPPSTTETPTTPPAPTAAPKAAVVTDGPSIDDEDRKEAFERARQVSGESSVSRAEALRRDMFGPQRTVAASSEQGKLRMIPLVKTILSLPEGQSLATSGPFSQAVQPYIATLQNMAEMATGKKGIVINPDDLATQEKAKKFIANIAAETTTASGQTAVEAMRRIAEGIVNLGQSKAGQVGVLANVLANTQREIDKDRFYGEWVNAGSSDPTPGRTPGTYSDYAKLTSEHASRKFDQKYNADFYRREEELLTKMMTDKMRNRTTGEVVSAFEYMAKNGADMTPEMMENFTKKYGKGMLRYFGINRP
jgi:hypothetical protein